MFGDTKGVIRSRKSKDKAIQSQIDVFVKYINKVNKKYMLIGFNLKDNIFLGFQV